MPSRASSTSSSGSPASSCCPCSGGGQCRATRPPPADADVFSVRSGHCCSHGPAGLHERITTMRNLLRGTAAAALALAIGAAPVFAANAGAKPGPDTIVAIVLADDGEFDVLQAAVIEAGLAGALSSTANQYTVFAPTDAAFVSTFR